METHLISQSVAPDGTTHDIPSNEALREAFVSASKRALAHRERSGEIVAVQGLGFVGSAVAAAVAASRNADGTPRFFVFGTDLATPQSYWKIAKINAGEVPIPSPDTELTSALHTAVNVEKNLVATSDEGAYALADVIVVDLPLDVTERFTDTVEEIDVRLVPFERAIESIARTMREDALVVVETTVPIGVCEKVALPILERVRAERGFTTAPLLAHAYERVMPGPRYLDSIRRFWRTVSGIDDRSRKAAVEFMSGFIDVENFPLRELNSIKASEMAKVLENSYRAVNIAFMYEWTLLAERLEVNLFDVVNSIRVRKGTHDNMRYPGFGVGGYCLTKDSLLAQWSATTLFQTDIRLDMTLEALRINHEMPLHTLDLAEEAAGGSLDGKTIAVAGVSYLAEVADTRNSPTEVLADALTRRGVRFSASDPYLALWEERPAVSFATLAETLADAHGLILTVPHREYRDLHAASVKKLAPKLEFIVDAFDIVSDEIAHDLYQHGIRVAGVGKGHWRALGYHK